MNADSRNDAQIIASWRENAAPWTAAVRERHIESRNLVTNSAVVETVLSRSPKTVLDIGCGEGWLSRELAAKGIQVIGVDVVPELVERASRAGGGDFRTMSYEAIAAGELDVRVDLAVANFSLIGKDSVRALIAALPRMLAPHGTVVIQTLHPVIAGGDQPYLDGWRDGSWAGFSAEFSNPAPWYFRRIGSWIDLLRESGLQLVELREPMHPISGRPASIIFVAEMPG